MEHLNPETLARLADEAAAPEEAEHLDMCRRCREEVEAVRAQSRALSHLPDLRPPSGEWEALEAGLLGEGLLRREPALEHSSRIAPGGGRSLPGGGGWGPGPSRLQAAAAILFLVGGAGLGMGASALLNADAGAPSLPMTATVPGLSLDVVTLAALDPSAGEVELSMEEAEELVRLTEGWYLTALTRYRDQAVGRDAPPSGHGDPFTRYAALEALMAASQAAVREVPTDPFLNGLLVNMRAEREATLRGLWASSTTDNWY